MDNNREALSVLERNIKSCAFDNRTKIIKWNIKKNLNCLKSIRPLFDLVFLDPPYNQNMLKPALFNLDRSRSMKIGTCIVVEHSPMESIPKDLSTFETIDQRRYGKTLVSFLNYMI